ncbi:hypothetical protein DVB69_01315 [Sporosarcina sp. BI001-red]|uniref:TnsD family Tn7-like transposition protein n=1 Tax=Sporosarcina sp. BI001-red TaxID=2282866 RepID=UPI000E225C85|nr:TnsD family Tn7-like transposition protein [Sporosarcina sp. BI001-red]REB11006.1 hypothetical protein DVB69_01315 [Sporosarcina sp. BI001-red]
MLLLINYFPVLYEDELLYSVIARYRRKCGIVSSSALLKDIFGKKIILKSTYFPKHIDKLVGNLPITTKITTKELICGHTMFPFYTSFISEEKTISAYKMMSEGTGKSIEGRIGMGGSTVKSNIYLRYCPLCFGNDIELYGESYFRRMHQIVGGLYCLKHEVLLRDSTIFSTQINSDFLCIDEDVCRGQIIVDKYSLKTKEYNLQYLRNAEWLLKKEYQRVDLSYIISFYINSLRNRGLATPNGELYMNDVEKHFSGFYPNEYLNAMQSSLDLDCNLSWLRTFVRDNGKNRSPLRHLLFLQSLDIKVEELFAGEEVTGKIRGTSARNPKFAIEEMRAKWLQLLEENRDSSRSELKTKGKGLHTWVFKHDREWYEKVTPVVTRKKTRASSIDWAERDQECLQIAKRSVSIILKKEGKPVRVTPLSVRTTIGARNWYNNKKLIQTRQYLQDVKEDINVFRKRKIKWAITEMSEKGEKITVYKVQLYAGFGGGNLAIRKMIEQLLKE